MFEAEKRLQACLQLSLIVFFSLYLFDEIKHVSIASYFFNFFSRWLATHAHTIDCVSFCSTFSDFTCTACTCCQFQKRLPSIFDGTHTHKKGYACKIYRFQSKDYYYFTTHSPRFPYQALLCGRRDLWKTTHPIFYFDEIRLLGRIDSFGIYCFN